MLIKVKFCRRQGFGKSEKNRLTNAIRYLADHFISRVAYFRKPLALLLPLIISGTCSADCSVMNASAHALDVDSHGHLTGKVEFKGYCGDPPCRATANFTLAFISTVDMNGFPVNTPSQHSWKEYLRVREAGGFVEIEDIDAAIPVCGMTKCTIVRRTGQFHGGECN